MKQDFLMKDVLYCSKECAKIELQNRGYLSASKIEKMLDEGRYITQEEYDEAWENCEWGNYYGALCPVCEEIYNSYE